MMLKLGVFVITCLDHGVGRAAFLGIELCDVVLVRNLVVGSGNTGPGIRRLWRA